MKKAIEMLFLYEIFLSETPNASTIYILTLIKKHNVILL